MIYTVVYGISFHVFVGRRLSVWHGVVYERNPLWPSGGMPNLSVDFTSQCLKDSAKSFNNHAVVFISGSTKQVVRTFGIIIQVLTGEVHW